VWDLKELNYFVFSHALLHSIMVEKASRDLFAKYLSLIIAVEMLKFYMLCVCFC